MAYFSEDDFHGFGCNRRSHGVDRVGMSWLATHWTEALARRYENQWVAVGYDGIVASGNSRRVLEEELKMNRPGHEMREFLTAFVKPDLSLSQ